MNLPLYPGSSEKTVVDKTKTKKNNKKKTKKKKEKKTKKKKQNELPFF